MKRIDIKPIEPHQIEDAKRVIMRVARELYRWEATLEELMGQFDQGGQLADVNHYQSHYFDRGGLFLVVTDKAQVVGTGAVRRVSEGVCELKRLWLLEEYQGRGIGYRVLQKLIEFARSNGYVKMWLETDYEQARAIRFYRRAGFQTMDAYNDRDSDVYMGMDI